MGHVHAGSTAARRGAHGSCGRTKALDRERLGFDFSQRDGSFNNSLGRAWLAARSAHYFWAGEEQQPPSELSLDEGSSCNGDVFLEEHAAYARGRSALKKTRYRETCNVPGMRNTAGETGSVLYG